MLMLVVLTVSAALLFDVINGFHDATNSIATVVSTRVLKPLTAVVWAAFFNFVAMFFFAPLVADTISNIVIIDPQDSLYVFVVLFGLAGAIIWDLATWWLKLPTSSSHALIGGFAGAGIAHGGLNALHWDTLVKIFLFIFVAPIMGFILGVAFMLALYWLFQKWHPHAIDRLFRKGQLISAALYSIGHGANDAQKTMGVIMALLYAASYLPLEAQLSLKDGRTAWIIISCHAAMALGTALGGWRIVKTMGMRITKLEPVNGFCAESAGTCTLYLATFYGIPVSTTHTIIGSIIGVGSLKNKNSAVRWDIAGSIIWAWIITIPFSGILSGVIYLLYIKTLR